MQAMPAWLLSAAHLTQQALLSLLFLLLCYCPFVAVSVPTAERRVEVAGNVAQVVTDQLGGGLCGGLWVGYDGMVRMVKSGIPTES